MKNNSYTQKTHASASTIWELWSDVSTWNKWDAEVESASLNGKFAQNTTGELKPTKGPKAKFTITECIPEKAFTTETILPLCRMSISHRLETLNNGIQKIKHEINFSGPLSFIFSRLIGKSIAKSLPTAVSNLIQMAQTNQKNN